MIGYKFIDRDFGDSKNIISSQGIYISKIQLPKNTKSSMDMIGLIVYQGRLYTEGGTKIEPESAEKLLDEKLGTTKNSINEWSNQEHYAVEFASTIGEKNIYSVKGYDKSFRIMACIKENGIIYDAQFYECLNGITIKTGADFFNKLKLATDIKKAKYESFESWNNDRQQFKEVSKMQTLNNFINELENTVPYKTESLSHFFEDEDTEQKFIYISLNDGSEVQLRLFKSGYIKYSGLNIFFKMDELK